MPNFVVAGAAKSGTTSLYKYITQHEEVFVPKGKELRFFSNMHGHYKGPGDERSCNRRIISNTIDYEKLFAGRSETCLGDMSTEYLYYHEESIKNIKKYTENMKIFIILRNPVDRAYSHYLHMVRDGRENLSFEEAINKEQERKEKNWAWHWGYTTNGFYYNQVKDYLDNFPDTTVYIYDDLRKNQECVIKDMFTKLGVEPITLNTNLEHNVSGIPKNKKLHKLLNKPNRFLGLLKRSAGLFNKEDALFEMLQKISKSNLNKPKMKAETRTRLVNLYTKDIEQLESLLNKDLSSWKND